MWGRHDKVNARRTRINSKGQTVQSNFGIERPAPAIARCRGCGREFNAYSIRWGGYAACRDQGRLYALNEARAQRHADKCKGKKNENRGSASP